jgi:hypothetical protein
LKNSLISTSIIIMRSRGRRYCFCPSVHQPISPPSEFCFCAISRQLLTGFQSNFVGVFNTKRRKYNLHGPSRSRAGPPIVMQYIHIERGFPRHYTELTKPKKRKKKKTISYVNRRYQHRLKMFKMASNMAADFMQN